jgi:hypothetical protein
LSSPNASVHRSESDRLMSESGRVSRASPVQTAARNCTRDEGRSLGIGIQVLVSNHRKLLRSKAVVVSVAGTSGRTPAGMVRRGERKQTVDDVS